MLDDEIPEDAETMFLEISNPSSNAAILNSRAEGTIKDRKASVRVIGGKAKEGVDLSLGFTVIFSRAPGPGEVFSVDYTTVDGTATAPGDYEANSGNLRIEEGDDAVWVLNVPVTNDNVKEDEERMGLRISNPSEGLFITDSLDTGIITEEILISVADASQTESTDVTRNVAFVVKLDERPGTGNTVTVNYETVDGTGDGGSRLRSELRHDEIQRNRQAGERIRGHTGGQHRRADGDVHAAALEPVRRRDVHRRRERESNRENHRQGRDQRLGRSGG